MNYRKLVESKDYETLMKIGNYPNSQYALWLVKEESPGEIFTPWRVHKIKEMIKYRPLLELCKQEGRDLNKNYDNRKNAWQFFDAAFPGGDFSKKRAGKVEKILYDVSGVSRTQTGLQDFFLNVAGDVRYFYDYPNTSEESMGIVKRILKMGGMDYNEIQSRKRYNRGGINRSTMFYMLKRQDDVLGSVRNYWEKPLMIAQHEKRKSECEQPPSA